MKSRHLALPRVWMLTDERQGEDLWSAIDRLPRGAGVVVRHYSMPEGEREALFRRVQGIARRRGLSVAFSGTDQRARRLGADAVYGQDRRRSRLPRLYPVHSRAEIIEAERAGAALLLLSPSFGTRSHPESPALGPVRFGLLARTARTPVIALGGMTSRRAQRLAGFGAEGWAAIDAWIRT
jgi:thiamine-phosphate pyrophosphorylase